MNKFLSLSFFFWLFETNDHIQQLVSETHQGDSKVYDHSLTHNFGSILGIRKFGCKVKFETFVVIDKVICQLNVLLSRSVNDVLFKQWIDGWIKLFINVFKETGTSSLDSVLKILDKSVWTLIHVESFEKWAFVFFLDPINSLELRINTKWPSGGFSGQNTVLD